MITWLFILIVAILSLIYSYFVYRPELIPAIVLQSLLVTLLLMWSVLLARGLSFVLVDILYVRFRSATPSRRLRFTVGFAVFSIALLLNLIFVLQTDLIITLPIAFALLVVMGMLVYMEHRDSTRGWPMGGGPLPANPFQWMTRAARHGPANLPPHIVHEEGGDGVVVMTRPALQQALGKHLDVLDEVGWRLAASYGMDQQQTATLIDRMRTIYLDGVAGVEQHPQLQAPENEPAPPVEDPLARQLPADQPEQVGGEQPPIEPEQLRLSPLLNWMRQKPTSASEQPDTSARPGQPQQPADQEWTPSELSALQRQSASGKGRLIDQLVAGSGSIPVRKPTAERPQKKPLRLRMPFGGPSTSAPAPQAPPAPAPSPEPARAPAQPSWFRSLFQRQSAPDPAPAPAPETPPQPAPEPSPTESPPKRHGWFGRFRR